MDKLNFVQNEFPKLLAGLAPDAKGRWGKMNAQQMAEHMADAVKQATGLHTQKLFTPAEQVPAFRQFMLSDKEFRENTKNAMLGEEPAPLTQPGMKEAVDEYSKQVSAFVKYFRENKDATLTNAIFGDLNFEEWTHLLHKHATHHAKQFGLL